MPRAVLQAKNMHPFIPGDIVVVKPHARPDGSPGVDRQWVGLVTRAKLTDTPPYRHYCVSLDSPAACTGTWHDEAVLQMKRQSDINRLMLGPGRDELPAWLGSQVIWRDDLQMNRRPLYVVYAMRLTDGGGQIKLVIATPELCRGAYPNQVVVSSPHALAACHRWTLPPKKLIQLWARQSGELVVYPYW